MTTEEKLAAVGNAVKEPRKARSSEKNPQSSEAPALLTVEETTQAAETEQETPLPDGSLEQNNVPPAQEHVGHRPDKSAINPDAEHHGSHAPGKSIGKLMRFRRRKATRR